MCIQEAGIIVQHTAKHVDSVELTITLLKCALKAKADLQRGSSTALNIPRRSRSGTVIMIKEEEEMVCFPAITWQVTALSVRFRGNMQCDELQGQSKGV